MKRLKLKRALVAAMITTLMLVALQQSAYAAIGTKYWVQASESNTHYGCGAGVLVIQNPSVVYSKVTSIWATRTDEASYTEIGHSWTTSTNPKSFYVWSYNGSYNEVALETVTPGSTVSYKCGYDSGTGKHIFWKSGVQKASVTISNMTSSWPATNAEKDTDNDPNKDNSACFTSLTYKTTASGATWASWQGNKVWYDNDSMYSNKFVSANHVDITHN